jgi:hypothetical protein
MRKLLLATAAFAVLGAGQALAAGSDSVTVTTTVAESCSVTIPGTNVTLPADGNASAPEAFSFECNYTGETAQLTYASGFGGVSSDGGTTDHVYNIVTSHGADGDSATTFSSGVLATTALTPVAASVTLDLVNPILVAGVYTDTLTISIAP